MRALLDATFGGLLHNRNEETMLVRKKGRGESKKYYKTSFSARITKESLYASTVKSGFETACRSGALELLFSLRSIKLPGIP